MAKRYRFIVNLIVSVSIIYSIIPLYYFLTTPGTNKASRRKIDNLIGYDEESLPLNSGVELISNNDGSSSPALLSSSREINAIENQLLSHKKQLLDMESKLGEKQIEIDQVRKELRKEQQTRKQLELDLADRTAESSIKASKTGADQGGGSNAPALQAKITKRLYSTLPASSVYCYGTSKRDRVCRFKNLYYNSANGAFFIVVNRMSVINNVPADRSPALLDLTSLDDHGVFYFNYEEIGDSAMNKDQTVTVVEKMSFIFDRFHVGNVMHSLHDDVLALYHNIRHFQTADTSQDQPDFAAFNLDHHLWLFEGFGGGDYAHLFELFSLHPLKFKKDTDNLGVMCFQDAVVGQTKLANWYHYGFFEPQGPIQPKNISGHHVRQVADFIRYRLGLGDLIDYVGGVKPAAAVSEPDGVVIFSRTRDRLILNEEELRNSLSEKFKMPARFLRMEQDSFKEQVRVLSTTKIALGMHGSMLIMGMFLPRGSILIEFYPYAVPGDNYTPYRTMSNLPGMDIVYRKWENKYPENNVMHPDRSLYQGGIKHLPKAEQDAILNDPTVPKHTCCTNPYWLFRIYQDTKIHISEVTALVESSLEQSKEIRSRPIGHLGMSLVPARISADSIKCQPLYGDGKIKSVRVTWNAPWNGVKVDQYLVWEHLSYTEYPATTESITIEHQSYQPGATLQIWVRSVYQGKKGAYSDKVDCQLK